MEKILDFESFVCEKLDIQPLNGGVNTRFNQKFMLKNGDCCVMYDIKNKASDQYIYIDERHKKEMLSKGYIELTENDKAKGGGILLHFIEYDTDGAYCKVLHVSDFDNYLNNNETWLVGVFRSDRAPQAIDNNMLQYIKRMSMGETDYVAGLGFRTVWFKEKEFKTKILGHLPMTEKLNITPLSKERIKKMQTDIDLMKYMQKNQVELEAKINNDMLQAFNSRIYSFDNAMFSTLSFGNGINCGSKYNMYFTVSLQERECIVGQDIKKPFLDKTLNPISPTAEQRKRMADTGIDYYRKQTGERHLANFETEKIYTYYLKFNDIYIEKMVEYLKTKLSDYMDNDEYIVECVDDNGMNAYIAAKFNPKDRTFDKHLNAFAENVIVAVNDYVTGTFNKIFA